MKTAVPCKLVASPSFQLPEPLHVARFEQGPTKIVQPVYPDAAKKAGIQGAVVLDVVIGENGSVTEVTVVKGSSVLAKAATAAVLQWQYRPYLLNGKPVRAEGRVAVNFVLPTKKQGSPR
jgi:protein TonB